MRRYIFISILAGVLTLGLWSFTQARLNNPGVSSGAAGSFTTLTASGLSTFQQGFVSQASSTVTNLNFGKAIFSTPATAVTNNYEILRTTGSALVFNTPSTIDLRVNGTAALTIQSDGTILISTTTQVSAADTGINALTSSVNAETRANNAANSYGLSLTSFHAAGAHISSGELFGGLFVGAELVSGATSDKIGGVKARSQVDNGTLRQGPAFEGYIALTGGTMSSGTVFYAGNVDNTGGTLSRNYGLLVAPQGTGANSWGIAVDGEGTHSYFADGLQVGTSSYAGNRAGLLVQATSTVGMPLMIRDSGGTNILRVSSSTIILPSNILGGAMSSISAQLLDIGDNSTHRRGAIVMRTTLNGASPMIVMEDASPGRLGAVLQPSNIVLSNGGVTTSSLTNNTFDLNISSGNNQGIFSVDSSGNLFASGTVRTGISGAFTVNGSGTVGGNAFLATTGGAANSLRYGFSGYGMFMPSNANVGLVVNSLQMINLGPDFQMKMFQNGSVAPALVIGGVATTTITATNIEFATSTGNRAGVLNINSSGNISTSGTLAVFSSSTIGTKTTTTTIPAFLASGSVRFTSLPAAPSGINPLCIDANGNGYLGGSSICPLSALESKGNLKPISYGLKEILKTNFYDFKLKNDKSGRIHSGPIADYTDKYMPNLTERQGDSINGFDYLSMIGVEGQAIKDLYAIIQDQQRQINELKLKKHNSFNF